jgi:hypothetical protein
MNIYQCSICTKSFKTQDALNGHMKVHGPSNGKPTVNKCCSLLTKQTVLVRILEKHDLKYISDNTMDNECKHCQSLIKRTQNFCDQSCRTKYTNIRRGPRKETTKKNISIGLAKFNASKPPVNDTLPKYNLKQKNQRPKKEPIIIGPFSKLFMPTCGHCGNKFVNRRSVKYCHAHSDLYKSNNRNRYRFTFSISKYPDLFGSYSLLLKTHGMWSPTNTNGLTRDHRVSVNESIKNNYDPYYITHPLNCELMPWNQNMIKRTDSSITYEQLVILVNEYDQN